MTGSDRGPQGPGLTGSGLGWGLTCGMQGPWGPSSSRQAWLSGCCRPGPRPHGPLGSAPVPRELRAKGACWSPEGTWRPQDKWQRSPLGSLLCCQQVAPGPVACTQGQGTQSTAPGGNQLSEQLEAGAPRVNGEEKARWGPRTLRSQTQSGTPVPLPVCPPGWWPGQEAGGGAAEAGDEPASGRPSEPRLAPQPWSAGASVARVPARICYSPCRLLSPREEQDSLRMT